MSKPAGSAARAEKDSTITPNDGSTLTRLHGHSLLNSLTGLPRVIEAAKPRFIKSCNDFIFI
jgi:hypothetical protein